MTKTGPQRIIPAPPPVQIFTGCLTLSADTEYHIGFSDPQLTGDARKLADLLISLGLSVRLCGDTKPNSPALIRLVLSSSKAGAPEGYALRVTAEGVTVTGRLPAGIFYGSRFMERPG